MEIIAEKLVKFYDGQQVLKGVSFVVRPGRILGLLGPNGAGKTTTMQILTGVLAADGGQVQVLGATLDPANTALRDRIGYLAEHNPLYPDMYVREFLKFAGRLHRLDRLAHRIDEVLSLTGLEPEQHKQIRQLSKGYQQRVGLAQAILHDPAVLILDEPTTGLDPNQLIEIRALIKRLGKNKSVILSTHIMQEAEAICDDVAIIHKGRIVALETPRSIQGADNLEELFVQLTAGR